jgi:tetratricopeptide (TPR) repeat protein
MDQQHIIPDPAEADRLNYEGTIHMQNGKLDEAVEAFTGAIAYSDDAMLTAAAHFNRGAAHFTQGNMPAAIADFDAAIRFNAPFAEAYAARAAAQHKHGNHPAAIADYEEYLALGGGEANGNRAEIEGLIVELRRMNP